MDILAIYLTHKIIHKRITKLGLLLSGGAGSIIATALTVFFQNDSKAWQYAGVLLGFATSVVMVLIAFGTKMGIAGLFRASVILWGCGALLGGVMTLIVSLGKPVYGNAPAKGFIPLFAGCFTVTTVLVRLFSASRSKKTSEITVTVLSEEYIFRGICDSGSFLSEPISGKPVIIVKASAMPKIADELENNECKLKLRLIPASGIGGDALLKGFVPDRVNLDGEEVDAVVAIDKSNGKFGGCDGLIPSVLCK